MDMHAEKDTSVGAIRKEAVQEVIEDANHVLAASRGDHMLTELRKHVNVVFQTVARLKLLDGSSLSMGCLAMDVKKEEEGNTSRLSHMRTLADAMFYLNEDIKLWNVPQFEVPIGFHALVEGKMDFYPSVFDELMQPQPLPSPLSENLLSSISNRILSLVAKIDLRRGILLESVQNGSAWFVSPKEFRVRVTLTQAPPSMQTSHDTESMRSPGGLRSKEEDTNMDELRDLSIVVPDNAFNAEDEPEGLWWWSLTGLVVRPESDGTAALLEDFQIEYLRREFDARMISLASSIAEQRGQHRRDRDWLDPPSTGCVQSPKKGPKNDSDKQDSADCFDDQVAPLNLLFDMARDAASRVKLNLVRQSLKKMVGDDGPFRKLLSLVVSRVLKPGYRLYYWTGVPIIVECLLKDKKEDKKWREVRPWLEIGMGDGGSITVEHFPQLPRPAEGSLKDLRTLSSCSDLSHLVTRCASALARPLMSALLSELNNAVNVSEYPALEFELTETEDCLSLGGDELNTDMRITVPAIHAAVGGALLFKLTISLTHGNLQLECIDPARVQSKTFQKWEDRLNRVWKRSARSLTTELRHPNVAALGRVARLVLGHALRLSATQQRGLKQSDVVLCAKHGVAMPISFPPDALNGVEAATRERMMDASLTLNFPLKHLVIGRLSEEGTGGEDVPLNVQVVVSLTRDPLGNTHTASLVMLSHHADNPMEQAVNVSPVPKYVLSHSRHRVSAKKRKPEDLCVGPKTKREKYSVVNQETPESRETRNGEFDSNPGAPTPDATAPLSASAELMTDRLAAWCCEEALFAVLRDQLSASNVKLEEEFVPADGERYRHFLRLSKQERESTTVPSLNIGNVRIEIEEGGTGWLAFLESERFSEPLFSVQECRLVPSAKKDIDNASARRGAPHERTWGMPWSCGDDVGMRYSDSQSVGHMLDDFNAIAEAQTILDAICDCTSVRRKKWPRPSAQKRPIASPTQIGLMDFRLSVTVPPDRSLEVEQDGDALVSWNVRFSSKRVRQLERGGISRATVTAGNALSQTLEYPRKTSGDTLKTEKYHTLVLCSLKDSAVLSRLGCQCDTAVPAVVLRRIEDLLQTGQTEEFLLAICLTATALHHSQTLWQSSPWDIHVLPQSTALEWQFLCVKGRVERTLALRFHESGLLFIQVKRGKNGHESSTDVINCQSAEKMEGFAEVLLTMLNNSENPSNQNR